MPHLTATYPTDLLRLHAANPARYPYLLQTLGGTPGWDILFAFPQHKVVKRAQDAAAFLTQWDSAWQEQAQSSIAEAEDANLPFRGGWFAYLGYELLQEIEPSVSKRELNNKLPLAIAVRVPAAILLDHSRGKTYVFAESAHAVLLETMRYDLEHTPELACAIPQVSAIEEAPPAEFLAGIARIQHYIREGDIFQVNLARQWRATLAGDASALYAALQRSNPAPFGGLADLGDGNYVISSSPERLVQTRGDEIETRPIAGTRPRAEQGAEDQKLKAQLQSTAKERAEHIMLVDLERNDLGRVCKPGSVHVPVLLEVTSYTHVHHLESTVRGTLKPGTTPGQIIRALFPGGTITGCPKVRCMQIIRELETEARYAYTGSMGYINHDGSLDLNILIRSFLLQGSQLQFCAGAGIVADSQPEQELEETRAKAKGLLRALGVAKNNNDRE